MQSASFLAPVSYQFIDFKMKKNVILELPPLRDDTHGYNYLFKLVARIRSEPENLYTFNFSECSTISHSAVATLGALAIYLNRNERRKLLDFFFTGERVSFDVDSMSLLIRNYLTEINFLQHFDRHHPYEKLQRDYIGYREHDEHLDANEIAIHLMHHWLSDQNLRISEELKKSIISKIFEIYMNAYGHGVTSKQSKMPKVLSCGYHDTKAKQLKLCVLDFGMGIPKTVRNYVPSITNDLEAMKWALITGNSRV